jgi:hypothetical protein
VDEEQAPALTVRVDEQHARAATRIDHRLAVAYLAAQGALAVVWWLTMRASPTVRSWFELDTARHSALDAFLLADLLLFVGGSGLSAVAIARVWRSAPFLAAFTAGAVAYATLYLVSWVALEGAAIAGVAPMAIATVITAGIAWDVRDGVGAGEPR